MVPSDTLTPSGTLREPDPTWRQPFQILQEEVDAVNMGLDELETMFNENFDELKAIVNDLAEEVDVNSGNIALLKNYGEAFNNETVSLFVVSTNWRLT